MRADSRGRLVAGSFQGKTGHADGKHSEARFNHPKRSHSGMFMSLILRGMFMSLILRT